MADGGFLAGGGAFFGVPICEGSRCFMHCTYHHMTPSVSIRLYPTTLLCFATPTSRALGPWGVVRLGSRSVILFFLRSSLLLLLLGGVRLDLVLVGLQPVHIYVVSNAPTDTPKRLTHPPSPNHRLDDRQDPIASCPQLKRLRSKNTNITHSCHALKRCTNGLRAGALEE